MPSLLLSNPLAEDDAQRIGLDIRYYAPGEIITVNDFVFATLVRTGYGTPYGSDEDILLIGDGSPTAAVGTDGQWYLDRLNEVLWGPKTGGYWPSDPIRPDRGVSNFKIDAAGHLIVTYSTGTVVDLGRARFVSRGAWTAGAAYTVDDLVSSDGSMFRVTVAHTAAAPAPTRQAPGANYELWAAKGDQASLTQRVVTGSVTLAAADVFAAVDVDSAAAATVTVPTNATVPIPVHGWIEVGRIGAGAVTIAGATGVTVRSPDGNLTLRAQHSRVRLHQVATDVWALTGDNVDEATAAVRAASADVVANVIAKRDASGNLNASRFYVSTAAPASAGELTRMDYVDGRIATRIPNTEKGAANGVATLDAGGKLATGQVPAIALSDFLGTVASEAAMLALVGQRGDWTTRTDLGADFILIADDPTVVGNWRQITTPGKVTSVDGRTGAITLGDLYIADTERGAANGVAPLGADSKVPVANLPGIGDDAGGMYVPDVIDPAVPLEVTIVSNWGVTDTLTNLATDPRATADVANVKGAAGWQPRWYGSGGAGTTTFVTGATDGPLGIGTYRRKTWTSAPTTNNATGWQAQLNTGALFPVTAGETLTVSGYLRPSSAGKTGRASITWYDAAGAVVGTAALGALTALTAGAWARLSVTGTAPAGATQALLLIDIVDAAGQTLWAVNDTLDGTGLLIERSDVLHDYFDGSTGGTWTGTANASTSTHEPITYYDDAGAPTSEAGVLIPDPETGSVAVWRPGGAWSNYLDRRVADLIYDGASLTRAAGVRRYLGELADYPDAGVVLNGDYLYHSGLGCLMGRVNGAWRQLSLPRYADAATRTAVPAALLYTGFRAFQTDRQWELAWTGSAWSLVSGVTPGIRVVKTDTQTISNTWQRITWPAPAASALGTTTGMYDAAYTSRLTAPFRGRYRAVFGFTGVSNLQVRYNSAAYPGDPNAGVMIGASVTSDANYKTVTADEVVMNAGDYVEAFGWHGSSVTAGAINGYVPHFSLSYIGPA